LRAIAAEPSLTLQLVVGAAHLDPRFGKSIQEIKADGFEPAALVSATLEGDGPLAAAGVMKNVVAGVATACERLMPDIVVVLGDRYEMHAAVGAIVPFLVPIAHISGGAITKGAIDDGYRHAISKLSHIHFPETEEQKARLLRLGEEDWRIHVTGSLSVDNMSAFPVKPLAEVAVRFGLPLTEPPVLVTLHPETRDLKHTADQVAALCAALEAVDIPVVFTYPGADPHGQIIIAELEGFVRRHPGRAFALPHLGTEGYFGMMANARAMIGNSSSGIIEAASYRLPVVNIGHRQEGRLAPANVLHAPAEQSAIRAVLCKALSGQFRKDLSNLENPYGDGHAAERMVSVLKSVPLDERMLLKAEF
jgi:UDP-hydrolysing UDP-N-acetyl-D-glucosamine 2-epimerase